MSESVPTRRAGWPIVGVLFVTALLVRLSTWPTVVLGDRILFYGYDAYYHMRRAVYSLYDFPRLLDFDPYMNFPEGARAIWTPLFDAMLATLLWPFYDPASTRTVSLIASLVPPLIGAATVVAVYRIASRQLDHAAALAAGAALVILPGHFWYSQLGFVDHHCLIALVTTLLLGSAMAYCRSVAAGESRLREAIAVGLLIGLCLLVWPGTLLQVGIVQVALLAMLLRRADSRAAARGAEELAAIHLAALCVVTPFGLGNSWGQWSAMSPVVLSNFQPWYMGAAALFGFACGRTWRSAPALGGSAVGRAASGGAIGLGLIGASWIVLPSLSDGGAEALAWLGKTDAFQGLVSESSPLFIERGAFSIAPAAANLSAFFFLLPIALIALHLDSRRRPDAAPLRLLLFWTAVICCVAVVQRRFANTASIATALVLGASVRLLYLRALTKLADRAGKHRARGALTVGAVLAIGLLLAPAAIVYVPIAYTWASGHAGVHLTGVHYDKFAMTETASWLHANTPSTRGWLDVSAQPEYGVLAPWTMGHVIEYVGRRPTLTNNFGDDIGTRNFLTAREYFLAEEVRANEIISQLGIRYVIVPSRPAFLGERPGPRSIYNALFTWDGAEYRPGTGGGWVPGVSHHRLVYEFARTRIGSGKRASYKVFEVVRGAEVHGRVKPGTEVRVELDLLTRGQRLTKYAARTTADASGVWKLRVPYANTPIGGAVLVGDTYRIECGSRERGAPVRIELAEIVISEREVKRGAVVRAPDLCGGRR